MTPALKNLAYGVGLFFVFVFWLHSCHDPSVRATQKLADSTVVVNAHSHQTDLRVSRLAAESLELGARLMRLQRNDSVARREIARLKSRVYVSTDITDSTSRDTLVAIIHAHEADALRRDTLEAEQDSVIQSQDSSLTIWKALAVERGELLQRALQERDAFRKIATAWQGKAEKRLGCAGGPAVVASISGRVSAGVGVTCGIRF